ncbi:MAG: fibro-slime domain-containing protein [Flavonifractor sp.]|nr:fibro-slime domain-containing protein [Flavonifractor sp.]
MKKSPFFLRWSHKGGRGQQWWTRALALTLVFALVLPLGGQVAAREEVVGTLCVHHPEHTESCGYVAAQESAPCTHVHDESCGFAAPAESLPPEESAGPKETVEPEESSEPETPAEPEVSAEPDSDALAEEDQPPLAAAPEEIACGHVHDETCGYAEAREGQPCRFVCPWCVTDWQWEDAEDFLLWNEDAKLWGLSVPGADADNPVTGEMLGELLPKAITAQTAAGEKTVSLTWELQTFPEEGAYQGSYTLTASLEGEYALTETASALSVLLDLGGGEIYAFNVALNEWVWEGFDSGAGAVLAIDKDTIRSKDDLINAIRAIIPNRIYGWTVGDKSVNDGAYTYADKQERIVVHDADGKGNDIELLCSWGYLNVDWSGLGKQIEDLSNLNEQFVIHAPIPTFEGRKYYVNHGNNTTPNADELAITIRPTSFKSHTVTPAAPENVTVNLFDYWVETEEPSKETNGDILKKSDIHYHEEGGEGVLGDKPTGYSTEQDWNLGINKGHLLLFGDGMIHAGLWNKGAGENCRYGKQYAGMEEIVKNLLSKDGYPELNLENADKILTSNRESPEIDDNYNIDKYKLIKDYKLTGDHIDNKGDAYDSSDIQNLSKTVIDAWGRNIDTDTESLQYLFDPDIPNEHKTSYTDVTGLFQLDDEGYYYYNMRENFAEFVEEKGNNHFILYNAPATTRTDGKNSIGNFFPFNKGEEVFNGLTTDENGKEILSSMGIPCARNTMNHHLGMTVDITFRQPNEGVINVGTEKKPMTFGFSGDDDVWVFIDDVLVLDLGGIHSEIYGTIDFSTGEVRIGRAFTTHGIPEDPDGSDIVVTRTNLRNLFSAAGRGGEESAWKGNTFASNTDHELKMFYLERGNYDSSIALRFNLQPTLYQQVKKVDQNGEPVGGVEFKLYAAEEGEGGIPCLYTDSKNNAGKPFYVKQTGTEPLTSITTGPDGTVQFVSNEQTKQGEQLPFNFPDRGNAYYILHEVSAPEGYRALPTDIVLHYDPETAMLSVANRWTTGAYACSTSNIMGAGTPTYGQVTIKDGNADIQANTKLPVSPKKQRTGLVVAVPMLLQEHKGTWTALYGSNLEGFQSVEIAASANGDKAAQAWRKAVLYAALKQAGGSDSWSDWHLDWDEENHRLEGTLTDLPGLASRYLLYNKVNGDMRMVYGIIEPEALEALGIKGNTSQELYEALGEYVGKKGVKSTLETILGVEVPDTGSGQGFSFLNVDQFNRNFRAMIYIPNDQRELRLWKVDQDGKGVNGAVFALYKDGKELTTGTTAKVDGRDGVLIFAPYVEEDKAGYVNVTWADADGKFTYYIQEKKEPTGYEINPTKIPIVIGTHAVYAGAGDKNDGVKVMAGVGHLTQTMQQFAKDDGVDITLRDITAYGQSKDEFSEEWTDMELSTTLEGKPVLRSMNLHHGINKVMDYGLHDKDGGKNYDPFFVTDEGFIRARVEQNYPALMPDGPYPDQGATTDTNKSNLGEADLTSLFTLLNVIVVTDETKADTKTGKLTIEKTVVGDGLEEADYKKNFEFIVKFQDKNDEGRYEELGGEYYFYGSDKSGHIKSGDKIVLHHDESITILGLPVGTQYTVTETRDDKFSVTIPETKEYTGVIGEGNPDPDKGNIAAFINSESKLVIEKEVVGDGLEEADYTKNFEFTIEIKDAGGKVLSGAYNIVKTTKNETTKDSVTADGGIITVHLHHKQSVTIFGLPTNVKYRIVEVKADDWKAQDPVEVDFGKGIVDKETKAVTLTVKFVNSKETSTPTPPSPTLPSPTPPSPTPPSPTPPSPTPSSPTPPSPTPPSPTPPSPTPPTTETPPVTTETPPVTTETPPETPGGEETPPVSTESPPPEESEQPPEDPEDPPEEYPTELPDPNDPDAPDTITIWEDDVPKTYIKVWNEETEEFEYILDEEIPLANREPELETPATGDARLTGLWLLVNVLSLTGLAAVYFLKIHKKKRG